MTIQDALTAIGKNKPHSFENSALIGWLAELDGMVHKELILTHEHTHEQESFTPYTGTTSTTTVLLVPPPYDQIYLYWLASKIDYFNLEYDKYSNDQTLFNNSYLTYSDYYTRTHMPLQNVAQFNL